MPFLPSSPAQLAHLSRSPPQASLTFPNNNSIAASSTHRASLRMQAFSHPPSATRQASPTQPPPAAPQAPANPISSPRRAVVSLSRLRDDSAMSSRRADARRPRLWTPRRGSSEPMRRLRRRGALAKRSYVSAGLRWRGGVRREPAGAWRSVVTELRRRGAAVCRRARLWAAPARGCVGAGPQRRETVAVRGCSGERLQWTGDKGRP